MFQDIKNKKAKMMKKINEIMHLKLQIKNVKLFVRNNKKNKYALIII